MIILIMACFVIALGLRYAHLLTLSANMKVRTTTLVSIMPYTWFCCGLVTPFFFWLAKGPGALKDNRVLTVMLHVIIILALSYLVNLVYFSYFFQLPLDGAMKTRMISSNFFIVTLPFALIVSGIGVIRSHINSRIRKLESEKLKSQLAEARLNVMNLQLQPHFLFNTMQGISTLMYTNVEAADKVLHGLSDFLRYVLTKGSQHEVSLEEELEALSFYLDICKERFGDRYHFEQDIEPEVINAKVPFLLLQPLVENVFKHVVEEQSSQVKIKLRVSKEVNNLNIELIDNGRGLPESITPGTGLSTMVERLNQLYGDQQKFVIRNNEQGGASIKIVIPFQPMNP